MTDDQRAKMMMYHRVSVFLGDNAGDFTGTIVPTLLPELGTIIEDVHAAAAIQEVGTAVPTAGRDTKRTALIKMLNKLSL